ncbi:MAG: spore protease YyaC [Defluviitaleaceae bacterium]|nr:spore protease YyaC [Defluviitaleaceae bacterium]
MLINKNITYIDTNKENAVNYFTNVFYEIFKNLYSNDKEIIILCIGTDKVTGDSLGPLIGYKLYNYSPKNVTIYGTLENPVHAKNLEEIVYEINKKYKNKFVIAVDASLGLEKNIGCLTIGEGSIKPGQGVNKILPEVGDMFVTGIVNQNGIFGHMSIQNTRLGIVMKMADIAYSGMVNVISLI